MKKRKNLWYNLTFLVMAVFLSVPIPVFAQSTKITNKNATGAVDITLNYEMDGETGNLLPGQRVGLKSSITNGAEPAWIRVRVQYPVYTNKVTLEHLAEENLTELDDALITFANMDWEKIGPYYYLKRPVKPKETVPFTKEIQFPSDWDNRIISSKFGICITAEAIQKKNFEPNFKEKDPWYGVVIEGFDATDYRIKGEGTERFSVRYEGGAENLIHVGDNFFSNWDSIMPGDKVHGEADIENNMNQTVRLFFGIESTKNKDEEELLKQLHLTIRHEKGVLYDGNLAGSMDEMMVHEFKPKEGDVLSYTLTAPASMNNDYAQKAFQTVWTFRTEVVPDPVKPTPIEIIKTGDTAFLLRAAVIGLLLMIVTGIGLYFTKRGQKK